MKRQRLRQPAREGLVQVGGEPVAVENQRQVTVDKGARRAVIDHPVVREVAREIGNVNAGGKEPIQAANQPDNAKAQPAWRPHPGLFAERCVPIHPLNYHPVPPWRSDNLAVFRFR